MDRGSAIGCAVSDCIRQGVLKEFFEEYGSEVENMLLSEWNWDDAKRVWQEEAREECEARGMEKLLALWEKGVSLEEAKNFFAGKN